MGLFWNTTQVRIGLVTNKAQQCKNCGKSTHNPRFCSKSCSAVYNNRLTPKRSLSNKCKQCDTKIFSGRSYCKSCYNKITEKHNDLTLGDAMKRYSKHHRSSAFAIVRTRARQIAKKLGYNKCAECGYSKHIEVAHIKAISSFDLSTLISAINSPENLIPLCPNCHWEFDHP